MATLAITPASGSITAVKSVCRVDVTNAADNRPPDDTGGEFRYRLKAYGVAGVDDLVSHEFNASYGGAHQWNSLVFPAAGTYTLDLVDTSDDSVEATLEVVVS